MKCDEVMELAWDDPLVAQHAQDCAACAAWAEAWRYQLKAPPCPTWMTASVLAHLEARRPPAPAWWAWLWRVILGGATTCYLLLLLTLGYTLLQPAAPPNLAPNLIIYWASLRDGAGPLDGGL